MKLLETAPVPLDHANPVGGTEAGGLHGRAVVLQMRSWWMPKGWRMEGRAAVVFALPLPTQLTRSPPKIVEEGAEKPWP